MKLLISLILTLFLTANVFAWGREGHRIVARIAEMHLTTKTRQALNNPNLLGSLPDGFADCSSAPNLAEKMACAAPWADDVRKRDDKLVNPDKDFPQTENWHFVDISLQDGDFKPERDCVESSKKGFCGISALTALANYLKQTGALSNPPTTAFILGKFNPALTDFDRRDALRFIIHIVGDLHQPMHTVEEGGGENGFDVLYLDDCLKKVGNNCAKPAVTNIHHVWDTEIISTFGEFNNLKEIQYAAFLDQNVNIPDNPQSGQVVPVNWLIETHQIAIADFARFQALKEIKTPQGDTLPHVDNDYVKTNAPLINKQLKRAGIRLARVLNFIFDK